MNRADARARLQELLDDYRRESYRELQRLMDVPDTRVVRGASGAEYQVEVEAMWDDKPNGDLRVMGTIDDSALWSSILPLTHGFIITSDGRFVGE